MDNNNKQVLEMLRYLLQQEIELEDGPELYSNLLNYYGITDDDVTIFFGTVLNDNQK